MKLKIKTKALSLPLVNYDTQSVLLTLGAVFCISAVPLIFAHTPQNQIITGSLVNLILFAAVARLGLFNALILCPIPSLIALLRGLLPAMLAPVIPIIILSNAVLVIAFQVLKQRSGITKVVAASFLKTAFLYTLVALLFSVPEQFKYMISLNQALTALIGGTFFLGLNQIKLKQK
ncbi:MAG: ECF transporter S component [Candidatus Moranbacteria bacterium]|nr:ECF transporter S component [Candidatus Moranbacteria bacterium]